MPPLPKGKQEKKNFLAMCEPEAAAGTCFARFRACKSFVVQVPAAPLSDVCGSTLSNVVVRRISSERVCVRCFNPFLLRSSLAANRRSPAGAPTSVRVGEHKVEPPGGGGACPEPGHLLAKRGEPA